jgi:hypothetical protein
MEDGMNPEYEKLAKLAYDIVIKTMLEGEKAHPRNEELQELELHHVDHAYEHIQKHYKCDETEPHIEHAITRLVIAEAKERHLLNPCVGCEVIIKGIPYVCKCPAWREYEKVNI